MTDTPPPADPAEGIDPQRIRDAFTSRELGLWEMTVGAQLSEFGSAYLMAMLAWWGAHQEGGQGGSPDEYLDMPLSQLTPYVERATELLGKAPTGDALPYGMSTASEPETSPGSGISTTSPSPQWQGSPG